MNVPTILVLTRQHTSSVESVIAHLRKMDELCVRVDVERCIADNALLSLWCDAEKMRGTLVVNDANIDLCAIKSVWYRRPEYPLAENTQNPLWKKFIEDEFRSSLWSLYTSLDTAFWMNKPLWSSHLLEHNKFYQLKIAAAVGFSVPRTLVSNNADELIHFSQQCGGTIAVKTVRSRIFQIDSETCFGIYTNRVSTEMLVRSRGNIQSTPLMAQEYIPKKVELRITIVGDSIFACAIHSQQSEKTKDDWRHYDFDHVQHEPYQLPVEIEQKLLMFMRECHLSFGAVDMILTPEGTFVFLEINPSGQFGWIEKLTGLPISRAIAEALAHPPCIR